MKTIIWNSLNKTEQQACLQRPTFTNNADIVAKVTDILQNVRKNGDEAVQSYTKQFDGVMLKSFLAEKQIESLDQKICKAIDNAYKNIKEFHQKQGFTSYSVETMPDVKCQRIVRPLENIGLYVPSGTAPLVSTALMLGVPAQIATCKNIILCTPCDINGDINPYISYAAELCGITNIFKIGGAQSIAAMAYGTQTIPKCCKIFGPGNAYVTEAKIQVSRDIEGAAIDMPAGSSEVCVIANETGNPEFIAADLLSQAEHDKNSQVVLITSSQDLSDQVQNEINKQLKALPRRDIAKAALENSLAIIVNNMDEAIMLANQYAPEHLIIAFEDAEQYLDDIQNAGSVFLNQWTPESVGDYASGTNHVLPTYGYARSYSGLSVEAFQKTMTVQTITKTGLKNIGQTVETLALLEGLDAHARAISIRRESI
ncbi:MAG: histidinol dehydrogenase [Alphaproteobacteria bacterium]|nr:histidinol dehydrogenase [Alphaproteobacteria bacterium]